MLCNMLGEVQELLVMKEAQPVGEVVHAIVQNEHGAPGEAHADADPDTLRALLRRMTRSLFRPTLDQRRLVVKESWLGSANCGLLADAFPEGADRVVTRRPRTWWRPSSPCRRRGSATCCSGRGGSWELLPSLRGDGPSYVDVLTL